MMALHGLQSLFPMEDLAVMGIWELLPHLYKIRVCMIMLSMYMPSHFFGSSINFNSIRISLLFGSEVFGFQIPGKVERITGSCFFVQTTCHSDSGCKGFLFPFP